MRIIKYFFTAFLTTICISNTQAQDLILSQPFASSLYLGPSFAGMTNGGRAFLTYRNQWAGFSGGYNTAMLGADYFFRRQNSSIGGLISYDRQVNGAFTSIEFHPQYNYRVELNRNLYFRPGVELSVYYKSINPDKLIFADQIAVDGTIIDKRSVEEFQQEGGVKVDVAVSALLYNNNFWFGMAMHHITESDISFIDSDVKTPRRYSAFGGYRFVYNRNWQQDLEDAFTLAAIVQHQTYTQLQIGAYWHKMPIEIGVWYRDLPFVSKNNLMNRDAIICMLGYTYENLKISYSYDITLSKLSGYSSGSHEIVLTVKFNQKNESDVSFFCY